MLKYSFLLFFSKKLAFVKGFIFFFAGLSLGVSNYTLSIILLLVALAVSFLCCHLEAWQFKSTRCESEAAHMNNNPLADAMQQSLAEIMKAASSSAR